MQVYNTFATSVANVCYVFQEVSIFHYLWSRESWETFITLWR